jgi:hypothetical protein
VTRTFCTHQQQQQQQQQQHPSRTGDYAGAKKQKSLQTGTKKQKHGK